MATKPDHPFMCVAPRSQAVEKVVEIAEDVFAAMGTHYYDNPSPPPPELQMYALAGVIAHLNTNIPRETFITIMKAFTEVTLRSFDLNTRAKAHTNATTAQH